MRNLIKLLFAAGTLVLTSSVFLFYKWLTKYKDDDKKNGNTKQNTANKDTVEPPVIRAEDNTINQSESGNNEEIQIDCRPRTGVIKSTYDSTGETTNQSRLERIVAGPCTDVLRDVLLKEISPSNLLNKVLHVIQLRGRKTQPQYYDIKEILNRNLSYSEFDITLLYFALRNLCNFQPHSNCWGKDPNPIDRTVSANIERLRLLKNTHKSHTPKFHISDFDYGKARIEILKSVSDLEMYLENKTDYQNEIKRLENISMDFEQEVNLQEEANNIKDSVVTFNSELSIKLSIKANFENARICFKTKSKYEEFDDVAKLVVFKRLSSFCDFIESAINTLKETLCGSVERKNIPNIASQATNKTKGEIVGIFEIERNWKKWVDEEIHQIISKKERPNLDATRYKKIEDGLTDILRRLQEFRDNIGPTDQMKLIHEWSKGEVIHNSSALKNNKSIVEYIVGHRGDGNTVVKVFLRNDDEMAKELFKNCCKDSRNIKFEFVSIEEEKKKKKSKNNYPALDVSIRNKFKKIVQKYGYKIFATYTNVVGVVQDVCEKGNPCIVLYCLDETLMPFGEKPLPETIEGWPCKIKETIPMFGACKNCQYPMQNNVMPGCSIGIESTSGSGSVGFLVESKMPMGVLESGFLTSSHVAIADFLELYSHQTLLSKHPLGNEKHYIVHPSYEDNNNCNNLVGEVVESFIGNYGLSETGLDIAVVKTVSGSREGKKESLQVVSEDVLFSGEQKVMKCGRGSGKTFGYLKGDSLALKLASFGLNRYLTFNNCYAVEGIDQHFFEDGDSGAGVYVVKNDNSLQPLGIAFARFGQTTAVCKIDEFLNKLDLTIVRYIENTEYFFENA